MNPPCPQCNGAFLVMTSVGMVNAYLERTTTFQCAACLGVVEYRGPNDVDAKCAVEEYIRTGAAQRGSVSLQPGYVSAPTYIQSTYYGYVTSPVYNYPAWTNVSAAAAPKEIERAEPGPELQTVNGSVIGYRAWRIRDWVLGGTVVEEKWTPGINEARCCVYGPLHPALHPAPHDECQCGMYALARFDDSTSWWSNADVLGAVEAWADTNDKNYDRFFVHGTGFRAQYAKIVLLAVSDDYPKAKNAAIRTLATEYGADTCKREHLEDAAKEHGQLISDEMLAWAKEGEPEHDPGAWSNWYGVSSTPPPPKQKVLTHGICQTLGYVGPPSYGKYRKGDRVRDRKGKIFQCVKGGQPGTWEAENKSHAEASQ